MIDAVAGRLFLKANSTIMYSRQFMFAAILLFISYAAVAQPADPKIKGRDKIKVLAFDAFPVFDPRPVFGLAEELFPGHGKALSDTWKTRLFEYQWQRMLSGNYKDFMGIVEDALVFSAKLHRLDLTTEKREKLVHAFLNLKVWPDVMPALAQLKKEGYQLVFLSNMTEQMLRQNLTGNEAEGFFTAIYSTDMNHSYKPAPAAYELAVKHLHLRKEEIGFVAFAGWDAAGAKTFGYPTFWVNRLKTPAEELDVKPDWTGNTLQELADALVQ